MTTIVAAAAAAAAAADGKPPTVMTCEPLAREWERGKDKPLRIGEIGLPIRTPSDTVELCSRNVHRKTFFFASRADHLIKVRQKTRLVVFLPASPAMAHRIITQVILTGSRVFGRAFAEAYRQAAAASKQSQHARNSPGGGRTAASAGLTLDEACKILNVPPPKGGQTNMEHVLERFKRLYDANEPSKGGSFYLQSKVLRARERIELEVGEAVEAAEREAAAKTGWRPKLYKD